MGKTIGGRKVGRGNIDVRRTGSAPTVLGGLRDIADRRSRLQVQEGISRFVAEYGFSTRDIKVGEIEGAYGVAYIGGPDEGLVILNKKYTDDPALKLSATRREYKSGFKVKTNAPLKHTVIHEMAHIKWNTMKAAREGGKYAQAGEEIKRLYSSYRKVAERGRFPIGQYATVNINEFFAEATTGSLIGTRQNRWTRGVRRIIKKYNL